MTKEEKDLLLKDLCARLSYGVKISVQSWDEEEQEYVDKVDMLYSVNKDEYIKSANEDYDFNIEDIKPYLLPLSSMTEEQSKELEEIDPEFYSLIYNNGEIYVSMDLRGYDWLNKNNFDYRGLIPKGLAIDCTNLNIY